MKKLFLLIIFTCTVFILNIQANANYNNSLTQTKESAYFINNNDSTPEGPLPKSVDNAIFLYEGNTFFRVNPAFVSDSASFEYDPFFYNSSLLGNFFSKSANVKGSWVYEGPHFPTIYFTGLQQSDEHNTFYLGYSLSENETTGRKVGTYVWRDDGVIFRFSPDGITTETSVPKGLLNGSDFYKRYYSGEKVTAKTHPPVNSNFNNAPAGTPSAKDVLGTATIIDSSSAGIFIKITRPNNITLVNVIKLDKYPNANVYLSTKLIKIGNLPQLAYGLYNIGQNGSYNVSPIPQSMGSAYAKYSSSPWSGTSN